jgi:hypothetical protein
VSDDSLDASQVPKILKRFAVDRAFWTLVEVTSEVLTAAEVIVAADPIRTLDAIHVASAQVFATRLAASESIFVSADKRQAAAAAAVGMKARHV